MNRILCLSLVAASLVGHARENDAIDGGRLTYWPKDHGTYLFVNAQQAIPAEKFAGPVRILFNNFGFDIRLVDGIAPEAKGVRKELKRLGAKGAIWIVNDRDMPLTLDACDNGWGFINVEPLLRDDPDEEKLASRIEKIVNRTFAYIHGVGETTLTPHCVMKSAIGVPGLDKLHCAQFSPEPIRRISPYMKGLGYLRCKRSTYLSACEEGWAPQPTNDVQKAIWDKVHAVPTEPLKIKPETKKVAE